MALKSVVLHLGAHKTATSLIQKYMRDNPKLCQRAGIVALRRSDCDKLLRWGRGADVAAGRDELRERIAEAEQDGADLFVISHENSLGQPLTPTGGRLYPHARERALAIRKALDGLPVTVIYYVREPVDFVESYYLQTVHEGGMASFSRWFGGFKSPSLSWRPVYDDLCNAFGPHATHVRSFDREIKAGQAAFLKGFLSIFAQDALKPFGDFSYAPIRNASIGDKGLDIALAVNRFTETSAERKLVRKFLQDHFSNQNYARPTLMGTGQRQEMAEAYKLDVQDVLTRSDLAVTAPPVAR